MRWKSASRPLFLPYCSPLVHLTRQRELIHQEGHDQLHGAGALSARKVSTDVPPQSSPAPMRKPHDCEVWSFDFPQRNVSRDCCIRARQFFLAAWHLKIILRYTSSSRMPCRMEDCGCEDVLSSGFLPQGMPGQVIEQLCC